MYTWLQTDRLSYRLWTLRLTSEQENSGVIWYPNVRTSSLLQIHVLCSVFMENPQDLSAVQTHNAFRQQAASSRLSAGFKRVCRLCWTRFNFPQLIAIQTWCCGVSNCCLIKLRELIVNVYNSYIMKTLLYTTNQILPHHHTEICRFMHYRAN